MLDGWARRQIDPLLGAIATRLADAGIGANQITVAGCALGVAAAGLIAFEAYWPALIFILVSRLCDGLDGAVADLSGKTDLGGYLDIVLDFVFYGAIPIGFVLAEPAANAVAGAALLFSFYVNGASFLAYAVMAEKRKLTTTARGPKSMFFTAGLAEATETLLFFVAFCALPDWFAPLAWVFATVTLYTALSRIVLATRTFG